MPDEGRNEVADRGPIELVVRLGHYRADRVCGSFGVSLDELIGNFGNGAYFVFGRHGLSLPVGR